MFAGLPTSSRHVRSYRIIAASVTLHLAGLAAIIFHHPKMITLEPVWLAYGNRTHTYQVAYVPLGPEGEAAENKLILPRDASASHKRPNSSTTKPPANREQVRLDADASDHNAKAGSPLGTLIEGPIVGHEVRVAYPVVFPDPPIARSQLPPDLSGDVIVEVTIDSAGNVVETRIIAAIGHGIDEKIVATLRQWRYQPATLDGVPVASKHDVHFHFPS